MANIQLVSWCENAQFSQSFGRIAQNIRQFCAFPQKFNTRKLVEITMFYVALLKKLIFYDCMREHILTYIYVLAC